MYLEGLSTKNNQGEGQPRPASKDLVGGRKQNDGEGRITTRGRVVVLVYV